jgi:hypothetical protein
MRFRRGRKLAVTVGAIVIAAGGLMTAAESPAFAAQGQRHFIRITLDPGEVTDWSASADLYDPDGSFVYHWHESHPGGTNYVLWNFTYGGTGGWINLNIEPSADQTYTYNNLYLGVNRCYVITAPVLGNVSEVDSLPC